MLRVSGLYGIARHVFAVGRETHLSVMAFLLRRVLSGPDEKVFWSQYMGKFSTVAIRKRNGIHMGLLAYLVGRTWLVYGAWMGTVLFT